MPSFLYNEEEILKRIPDAHIMGNGTVTCGAKFVNDPSVRVDVIVVKRNFKAERVMVKQNEQVS
jgi:hypothetical protein